MYIILIISKRIQKKLILKEFIAIHYIVAMYMTLDPSLKNCNVTNIRSTFERDARYLQRRENKINNIIRVPTYIDTNIITPNKEIQFIFIYCHNS